MMRYGLRQDGSRKIEVPHDESESRDCAQFADENAVPATPKQFGKTARSTPSVLRQGLAAHPLHVTTTN